MERRLFDEVVQRADIGRWRPAQGEGPVLSVRCGAGLTENADDSFKQLERLQVIAASCDVPLQLAGGGGGCIDFEFIAAAGVPPHTLHALMDNPTFVSALDCTAATEIAIRRTSDPGEYERRSVQKIYVFTDRLPAGDTFSAQGGEGLAAAVYEVDVPVMTPRVSPSTHIWRRVTKLLQRRAPPKATRLRAALPSEVAAAAAEAGDGALLNIHGIATTFERALIDTAELALRLELDKLRLNTCLFSWPADGSPLRYPEQTRVGESSEQMLAATLSALSGRTSALHAIAHSHGAKILVRAAAHALAQGLPVAPTLRNVLLVAPDVDQKFLTANLPYLFRHFRSGVLYSCTFDLALYMAQKAEGAPRAGQVGVEVGDLPVESISVDALVSLGRGFAHSYHVDTQPISSDMYYALRGIPAPERYGVTRRDGSKTFQLAFR